MSRSEWESSGNERVSTRTVRLDDDHSLTDLATYVRRAARADPDGAARLQLVGTAATSALAVYVCPVHGGGGPTVLGLRTFAVGAGTGDLDVVVALASLTDRLARPGVGRELAVPPVEVSGVVWAGVSPPRAGWEKVGVVSARELAEVARRGIAEIASGAQDVAGSAAVATLRSRVWGRPVGSGAAAVPAGAAFVTQVLGFLPGPSPVEESRADSSGWADIPVRAAGAWRRLTTPAGHVLARPSLLGA